MGNIKIGILSDYEIQKMIYDLIYEMSPEKRLELFCYLKDCFCIECGGFAPCQCWNDD